jgi:peptidoglycan/xylan/chitin deacetylase (PgdA/CDA1 family)
MRVVLLGALALASALAGTPAGPAVAQASADCAQPRQALGVSRVVEIDGQGSARFGHQQYKDHDFLADGEVVLTFDDGPLRAYTQPVLDALKAHCTLATFFMVGRMAVADPELVREIARRGHTVGTHTWTHANLRSMGPAQAQREIELGFSAVRRAAGRPIAPFFRFPYLADTKAMLAHLATRDIAVFSIDADANDYRTEDPAAVHAAIIGQLTHKRKGILLFHDIQPSTARALRGLLDELKRRGFRVVHLVAKGEARTLPDEDRIAERAIGEKRSAAATSPLAKRSVVWPVQPLPEPVRTDLPPLPPAGPVARVRPPPREERWQDTIFRN